MTFPELRAAIWDAGWRGWVIQSERHGVVTLGEGRALMLPGGDVDALDAMDSLAVVDTAAEVNEVMRAWGCV